MSLQQEYKVSAMSPMPSLRGWSHREYNPTLILEETPPYFSLRAASQKAQPTETYSSDPGCVTEKKLIHLSVLLPQW